jgi:hypothetical protein
MRSTADVLLGKNDRTVRTKSWSKLDVEIKTGSFHEHEGKDVAYFGYDVVAKCAIYREVNI